MSRGLVVSRSRAQQLIEEGKVTVGNAPALNAARMVHPGDPVEILAPSSPYVGRGGEKLAAALQRFEIDVSGLVALDAGASTGGFTDVLLQNGARRVVAVDVGRNQLHERLRSDERVINHERTNIRLVQVEDLEDAPFSLVVADLSFISLTKVVPVLVDHLAADGANLLLLIKPQFEAGRAEVSKGRGVVRDAIVWRRVIAGVLAATEASGAATMGLMVSPIHGADGNVEFIAWLRAHSTNGVDIDIHAVVDEAGA